MRSLYAQLILTMAFAGLSGCDAIDSLNEEKDGNVTEQQPVALQTGQAASTEHVLRTDYIKEMLIDPPQGKWPAPLPVLEWRTSLAEGWQAVRQEQRPMLILVHCPVATHADTLDERLLSPAPQLSEVLRQYVTVELSDGQQIDLERMPFTRYQDPDQTWWCWILSPEGQVYSVLGSETPNSQPVTEDECAAWLSRVLDHHWDPRRPKWNADGLAIPADLPPRTIVQNPGYDRWRKGAEYLETRRNGGECMCCHQVQDVFWVERDLELKFRVTEDYWIWPPPANTGLTLSGETVPLVVDVAAGSFSQRGRFQSQSTIGVVAERRVFSTTDVRAAISSLAGPTGLTVYSELGGQVVKSTLGLTPGTHRNYDLTWRHSIAESVLAGHPGFLPTPAAARLRTQLRIQNRLALVPEVAEGTPAWNSGVRSNQVIIKLGEITSDLTPEQFLFLFTLNNQVGSLATLTVRQGDNNWNPAQLEIPSISVLEIPLETLKPKED